MRPHRLILTALFLAGCSGHAASPSSAATPAARPAVAGDPPSVHIAPSSTRYRYEQVQHATREMMGQVNTTDATTTMLLTVAITAAAGGNVEAAFTVDSLGVTGSTEDTGPLDALRGKTFHAVLTPLGHLVSFTPPDTMPITVLGGETFKDFLPSLPGIALAPGAAWTDTVTPPPTNAQGASVRTQSIRSHHVVGWETHDGVRALHIMTTSTYTIAGEGSQGGANYTLAGQGTASSDRFVSSIGAYLGATGTDSAAIHVSVAAMGLDIPIHQSRHSTLTRLP